MLRIILIHPGSTDYDEQGRIQGNLDIPLNEHGGEEVAELCRRLRGSRIERIYCAACVSAAQTAEALGNALGAKVKVLKKLVNLDHGLWQGMRVEELKLKFPSVYRQYLDQPESVCPPAGETVGDARQRVEDTVRWLLRQHRDGVVGLVTPEPLCRLVRCTLKHCEMGNLLTAPEEHGRFEIIDVEPAALTR